MKDSIQVYMIVGLPCSGKSTWTKEHSKWCLSPAIINLDSYRQEIINDDFLFNKKILTQKYCQTHRKDITKAVIHKAKYEICKAILLRNTIYLDNMNLNKDQRIADMRSMKEYANKLGVNLLFNCSYFNTDLDICIERMNKRDNRSINKFPKSKTVTMFKNFKEKLQEPDKSECYSNFYKFDNFDLFRKG